MWIETYQGKNGTSYTFIERYKDPLTGKTKKVSVTMASDSARARKEASLQLNKLIEKRLNASPNKITNVTFKELSSDFIKLKSRSVRPSSMVAYNSIIKIINNYFEEDYLVDRITTKLVQDFFNSLNYSNEYLSSIRSFTVELFNYAVDLGYIEINPATKAKMSYKAKTASDMAKITNKYLEKDEMEALLSYLNSSKKTRPSARLAEFLYLTGMRVGEALALKNTDIDLENKVVHVSGTIDKLNGYANAKKGPTKTISSFRDVTLTKRTVALLETVLTENALQSKFSQKYNDRGFLFTTWSGTPLQINSFNQTLKRAAKKVGIPEEKNLSSHIFRHTHISILAENDVPLQAIMRRVGHKNSSITQEIYTHVTKKMQKNLIDKLENTGL